MKKTFSVLNAVFIAGALVLGYCYYEFGGLLMKGIASGGFVAVGLINLVYAVKCKAKLKFSVLMFCGLLISLIADVILNIEFIPGALIFALGHILYFIAYCNLESVKARDFIPIGILVIATTLLLTLAPCFDFDPKIMMYVCILYAWIISCMVGKAVSNYVRAKKNFNLVIVIGSLLFFFSDLMLVFNMFGGAPEICDTLCLASYYPAQCCLAYSIFKSVNE